MSVTERSRIFQPSGEPGDDEGSPAVASSRERTTIPTYEDGKLKTITYKFEKPSMNIEFHDLVYTVDTASGKKNLLDSISGCFESGKLSAIMGPSGAGKTTLMDVLMGLASNQAHGTILINGHVRNLHTFNTLSGYIMQEDLLRPHLTVEESMSMVADLKLSKAFSKSEKIDKIDEIIECMGLHDCRSVRTNFLSGGQRKRTSIALELINNPSVLFLDEPTSGLDPVAAAKCLKLLKSLSRKGRTIVCILHQLSSSLFYLLDHIYCMANGRCVYQGVPSQLVPFLERAGLACKSTYNPADFILEILDDDVENRLSEEIQNGKKILEASSQRQLALKNRDLLAVKDDFTKQSMQFRTSSIAQFLILYKRRMTIQKRDTTTLWILFLHHVLSATAIGLLFYGVGNDGSRPFENVKLCIAIAMFYTYTYSMIPALTFPEEMKYLKREYFNRWYSLNAYYMMTLLATLPLIIIYGAIFQVIVYLLTDQPLEWHRFLTLSAAAFMGGLISEGYGTAVGSLLQCTSASVVTPMLFAVQLTVAFYGFGSGPSIEPVMHKLMSLSYARCVLVMISLSVYEGRADMHCPPDELICIYKEPKLILRALGMSNQSLLCQALLLVFYYISIRVIVYYCLRFQLDRDLMFTKTKVINFINRLLKRKHTISNNESNFLSRS